MSARAPTEYIGRLALFVWCQAILKTSVLADSTDVFPLGEGLQCVYNYQDLLYSWSFGSYISVTDSGTIECTLLDSSMVNDTTIAWTVIEKKNAIRRIVANSPPTDTTFSISDSVSLSIYEHTYGHHELVSSSLVWEFPISFQNGQTFSIFRYSDSSRVMLAFRFGCMRFVDSDYDTLWFSSDSGLFKRSYSRCFDRDEYGWASWRNFTLLSRTVVSVEETDPFPTTVTLLQNYPNPFNPSTTVRYKLPSEAFVTLKVYSVLGQEVATLVNQKQEAGSYQVQFDGTELASGVYLYRLRAGDFVETRKLVLLR